MSATVADLRRAATILRNAAPEEFDAFAQVFNNYTWGLMAATVAAGSDTVLNAQGQAQQASAVNRLLSECGQTVVKPAPR